MWGEYILTYLFSKTLYLLLILSYSYIGDRIGRLNANIIFTFGTCLSTLLVWTLANSFGVLVAYSALFGLFCGSYFAMSKVSVAADITSYQSLVANLLSY